MSSIIDNTDKSKHRTEARVILYSKEYVETYEVQEFLIDILKKNCSKRSNRFIICTVIFLPFVKC